MKLMKNLNIKLSCYQLAMNLYGKTRRQTPDARISRKAQACSPTSGKGDAGGWAGVALKPRGRPTGTGRRLSAEQESEVQKLICNKTTDQMKKAYEQRPVEVKAWLAKHQDEVEVFYLPSYSPELNPDEMLNADLKPVVTSKATTSHMRKLQKSPERVKKYF